MKFDRLQQIVIEIENVNEGGRLQLGLTGVCRVDVERDTQDDHTVEPYQRAAVIGVCLVAAVVIGWRLRLVVIALHAVRAIPASGR